MNYKIVLYIIFCFLSAYSLTSLNFNNIIKKNKVIEIRILIIILSIIMGYLLTNFVIDFLNLTRIIWYSISYIYWGQIWKTEIWLLQ